MSEFYVGFMAGSAYMTLMAMLVSTVRHIWRNAVRNAAVQQAIERRTSEWEAAKRG